MNKMKKIENGYEWDTIEAWRVIGTWGNPTFFVYDEYLAEDLKNSSKVKAVNGPFDQWVWIRDNGISYKNLCEFENWCNSYGIRAPLRGRATKESIHALMKRWWEERREQ